MRSGMQSIPKRQPPRKRGSSGRVISKAIDARSTPGLSGVCRHAQENPAVAGMTSEIYE
jgi:hypothetical protein